MALLGHFGGGNGRLGGKSYWLLNTGETTILSLYTSPSKGLCAAPIVLTKTVDQSENLYLKRKPVAGDRERMVIAAEKRIVAAWNRFAVHKW